MPLHRQPDLFETQAELFGEDAETPTFRPDLDSVRAELQRILAEARSAESSPRRGLRSIAPSCRR